MKYDLEKILPHNPPMILLDDIVEYNLENKTLSATFRIYPKKIMFDKTLDGVSSLAGLEFMAQAIGCYSYFKEGQKEPKPGLLLGARLFNNSIDKFKNNCEYKVDIEESFCDNNIYAFDCKISDSEDNELQSACIKVYKNENIEELLK